MGWFGTSKCFPHLVVRMQVRWLPGAREVTEAIACKGCGATVNGDPIRVSRFTSIAEAAVAIEYAPNHGLAQGNSPLEDTWP
jgi:hypothetical protein